MVKWLSSNKNMWGNIEAMETTTENHLQFCLLEHTCSEDWKQSKENNSLENFLFSITPFYSSYQLTLQAPIQNKMFSVQTILFLAKENRNFLILSFGFQCQNVRDLLSYVPHHRLYIIQFLAYNFRSCFLFLVVLVLFSKCSLNLKT